MEDTRFKTLIKKANFEYKAYQEQGVNWCVNNETSDTLPNKVRGGIIADEMGLGKTITIIGTMFTNMLPKTLIVVPPVLINQWYNEILRTTGHKSLVFYGKNIKEITAETITENPIVITSYYAIATQKSTKKTSTILHSFVWSRVIFDEAHHLRNEKTTRFMGARLLKAKIRWLITGTPIQNREEDFYSLCAMLNLPYSYYKNPANIKTIINVFVLRRTKEEVGIKLPPISYEDHYVDWNSNEENQLAEDIHSSLAFTSVSKDKQTKFGAHMSNYPVILRMLRAKQCCVLPFLVKNQYESYKKNPTPESEPEPEELEPNDPASNYESAFKSTSKLSNVRDLICDRKNNKKGKIVFCQFRTEIDLLVYMLKQKNITNVATIDGRNTSESRTNILKEAHDVLILQIQTCCEGLNLQEHYSEIYFVSPHWNPSIEDQAIARCHRIGQKKPVDVFRFYMSEFKGDKEEKSITIEKYVNTVQENKREISAKIMSGNAPKSHPQDVEIVFDDDDDDTDSLDTDSLRGNSETDSIYAESDTEEDTKKTKTKTNIELVFEDDDE